MEEEPFRKELTELLNKHSKEKQSNTPDYILADYLIRSLEAFTAGVNIRERWHGRAED